MKARFLQCDGVVDYTPSSAVAAGDVIVTNGRIGIAKSAIAANVLGALAVEGVFVVQKCNDVIADGVAVYWDVDGNSIAGVAGEGCATTTSSGNTFMGYAVGAVGSTDANVNVSLFGGLAPSVTVKGPLDVVVADPGASGAISVTTSGNVSLVTAGAETRTLAVPTFVGQELLIAMKTKVGNAVLTVASAINATGNNTVTFSATGQMLRLVAVENGSAKAWRVVASDGADLTTV